MNEPIERIHEKEASEAFTKQALIFDDLYSSNTIIQYKRQRVRDHVKQLLKPHSTILELNAGTGEDAVYLAQEGHKVHATDISQAMLEMLEKKVHQSNLTGVITTELCSFTQLENLQEKGPYDMILSNFAGLNCTPELQKVLLSFAPLLKPAGIATLVLLPTFCLWETLLVFKGKFKTAFRRFFSRKGASAHIEGQFFMCWYYDPSFIRKTLQDSFEVVGCEGLCTIVPPSYIEHFAEKYPRTYKMLARKENKLKSKWPWKFIGDYYIISVKKKI